MTTNFEKLIPAGLLFNLAQIQNMDLIQVPMTKKLITQGKLEVTRIGTKLHVSREELIRYLEENTTARTAE